MIARLFLLLALALGLALPAQAQNGRRVALVIANGNYANTAKLGNPVNDGRIVAEGLKRAGFTSIDVANDQTLTAFQQTLRDFRAKADGAEVALVYYAGHGIEGQGKNWLIPVDARLAADRDLAFEAIDLDLVMQTIGGAKLRVAIVDACRNNPFGNSWRAGTRAVTQGLGRLEVDDVLVIYAAAPGQTAADGDGANSPFASSLARRLPEPGLAIQLLGGVVRDDVLAATDGAQRPFISASITGTAYYLVPAKGAMAQQQAQPKLPEITMASADTSPPQERTMARMGALGGGVRSAAKPAPAGGTGVPALSWTAQQNDLALSTLSVVRRIDGTDYAYEIAGIYPVKRLTGKPMPVAQYIRIQARDLRGEEAVALVGTRQELLGSWQPGSPFSMSFRMPRALIDGDRALSLRICMGAEKNCVFGPDLARPSVDAKMVTAKPSVAPIATKSFPLKRKPNP